MGYDSNTPDSSLIGEQEIGEPYYGGRAPHSFSGENLAGQD